MFVPSSRNRRDRIAAVVSLLAWAAIWSSSSSSDAGVIRADFGAGALIGTVISLLGNLFGWKRGKVDSSTLSALESIRNTVTDMGKSFLRGVVDVAAKLASMTGLFIRFIQRVFGKLYDLLVNVVQRIARILDKVFGPIIDFLNKVRAHLKKFYDKVLKPIIDTIEAVRGITRLLSFFGIDWAKKLDAKLAELEDYILAPYEFLVAKLNEAMNWINRIVTLDGLLQRAILLQSLLRDASHTTNIVLNAAMRDRGAGLIPRAPGEFGELDTDALRRDLEVHFHNGNGRYSGAIRESIANVKINLRRAA